MLRHEVEKETGLTRKAIQYYENEGLVTPYIEENGYRNYSQDDIKRLNDISIFRRLGLNLSEMKEIFKGFSSLESIIRKKEYEKQIDDRKLYLLKRIGNGEDVSKELKTLEVKESIFSRLTYAFPGYLGSSLFFHYEPFLRDPLEEDGYKAFKEFVSFLDRLPDLDLTLDEIKFLEDSSKGITTDAMIKVNEDKMRNIVNFEEWYGDNRVIIEKYMEYKESEEYYNSPINSINTKLKKFFLDNSYYEKAIPLLRTFSKKYNDYYKKMLVFNDKLETLIKNR